MGNRELNKEGCGLGLTISKNLAIALGGNIDVKSQVNKGSTFTLTLPVQKTLQKSITELFEKF